MEVEFWEEVQIESKDCVGDQNVDKVIHEEKECFLEDQNRKSNARNKSNIIIEELFILLLICFSQYLLCFHDL